MIFMILLHIFLYPSMLFFWSIPGHPVSVKKIHHELRLWTYS